MAPSLTATSTACHELQIPSHPFLDGKGASSVDACMGFAFQLTSQSLQRVRNVNFDLFVHPITQRNLYMKSSLSFLRLDTCLSRHLLASLFPSYNLIKRGAVERSALAIASSDCFTETTIKVAGLLRVIADVPSNNIVSSVLVYMEIIEETGGNNSYRQYV
ncbi:hypothetical protein D918_09337 [Trichuris suis]|nr:hypothetical protein D918_09337 [Trichuris suis]